MRYWKRLKPDSTVSTIEAYSHDLEIPGAVEIDEAEYNTLEKRLTDPSPPRSGHPAQLVSVNISSVRPARVKRMWKGKEFFYDCLVTESIIGQYQAGKIAIGDYLWVEFLDNNEEIGGREQIVIEKVRKTW
jgi:hypothetical protein